MSDEGPGVIGGSENHPINKKPVEIKITITPDGDLKVESPIMKDQVGMLGIIETAKLAVIQYNLNRQVNKIVKPKFNVGAFGKKRF